MKALLRRTVRLVLMMWALLALASPTHAVRSVGEVTLSIGASQIEREGKGEPVVRGYGIVPGDVIRTSSSGHVHVRFVDGALVSVRPDSVLQVVEYRYDAADPSASLIKFYLEKGIVRGISGLGAQAARDKFRLNTPLVAIGVKGTDFVTQARPQSAVVLVNQGAIVLAPLDGNCRADGFGPCASALSRELASSMKGMALIYRQAMPEPVLQPVNSLKGSDRISPTLLDDRLGDVNRATAVADSRNTEAAVELVASWNNIRKATDSRTAEPAVDVVATRNTLVWGRWGSTPEPGDNLTVPFLEALSGGKVTVGDGAYFLFRNEDIPNSLTSATGVTNFRLQGGVASYRDAAKAVSAATVDGGALAIDFGRKTFSTQLAVTAPGIGTQAVAASGTIDATTGIFLGNGGDSRVAGAVSLDIRQAGYLFSKRVSNGTLSGATLWSR